MQCDILIRGGEVIDPSEKLRGVHDVAVTAGKIVAVEPQLADIQATHTIDARGQLVVAGLIDLHVHVYPHIQLGLEPDPLCPAGGVTTLTFDAYRRETVDRAQTQIFSLVNLCCIGLMASHLGELVDRRYADPDGVVETIRRHPDAAVGVKIRAGRHIIGDGEIGQANLTDAIRAARESGTWLMVHIGECPMSIPDLVEQLDPGDCITHCFKGGGTRITDDNRRIHDAVQAAADRGVIFDVGHGFGSFNWDVVTDSLECGFEPTTISTDLHIRNLHGPVYDMPTTMSKFLMLGMSLERVIEASTTIPARILKREGELGTLRVGSVADIAVLEKQEGRFVFTDSYRETRIGNELLIASSTIRRGEIVPGGGGARMRHLAE